MAGPKWYVGRLWRQGCRVYSFMRSQRPTENMRFEGTALCGDRRPQVAVNAAITLERPLLVKGEPAPADRSGDRDRQGDRRGPDRVAHQVDPKALQGLYEYDCGVAAARQSARRQPRARHPQLYQTRQAVGRFHVGRAAGAADRRDRQGRHRVPNDLLQELDRWSSFVYETARPSRRGDARSWSFTPTTRRSCRTRSCAAASFITSLFRSDTMRAIVEVHFPGHQAAPGRRGAQLFYEIRDVAA